MRLLLSECSSSRAGAKRDNAERTSEREINTPRLNNAVVSDPLAKAVLMAICQRNSQSDWGAGGIAKLI